MGAGKSEKREIKVLHLEHALAQLQQTGMSHHLICRSQRPSSHPNERSGLRDKTAYLNCWRTFKTAGLK